LIFFAVLILTGADLTFVALTGAALIFGAALTGAFALVVLIVEVVALVDLTGVTLPVLDLTAAVLPVVDLTGTVFPVVGFTGVVLPFETVVPILGLAGVLVEVVLPLMGIGQDTPEGVTAALVARRKMMSMRLRTVFTFLAGVPLQPWSSESSAGRLVPVDVPVVPVFTVDPCAVLP
jgi:hypothetical protein